MRGIGLGFLGLALTSCTGTFPMERSASELALGSGRWGATAGIGQQPSALAGKENIRIREYFPETLYWNPEVVTDERGKAEIRLSMADSITTWRLTALANSKEGWLGSASRGVRVFQDFFVDVDFPVTLTQNDMVQVPVAVYNYKKESQTVHLEVRKEGWFELLDAPLKTVSMAVGEVKAVSFKIRVKTVGAQKLTVFAKSLDAQDAIRRSVEVVPDGKKFEVVMNDRLSEKIFQTFEIPKDAIPGSVKVFCKCYPGVYSQVIEGVEGMLGMPHG